MKITYQLTVFSNKNKKGMTLKNVYKRDKNAVLKLMTIRDDYEFIMIHEVETYPSGVSAYGPFISWDKTECKMIAYGKDNLYSKNRDEFTSDITPWYLLAEKKNRQEA